MLAYALLFIRSRTSLYGDLRASFFRDAEK